MAIFSRIIFGACALASIVNAAPFIVTVTDVVTVTTWVTTEDTTTIWEPASLSPAASTTSSTQSTIVPIFVAEHAPASSSSSSAVPTPITTPIVQVQQVASSSTTPYQAPTPVSSSSFKTSTTSTALAGSFVSRSGTCEGSGAACTGDVTHWDGGLGACGWNVNTASDMQIALPVGLMGAQSNGNPYCGRNVTLKNPVSGTTVQATVGDKCMGCTNFAIDCTDALFSVITDGKGDGRESGIQWWFT